VALTRGPSQRSFCTEAKPAVPATPVKSNKWLKRGLWGALLGIDLFWNCNSSGTSIYLLDYIINSDFDILMDKFRTKLPPEETEKRAKVVILGTGNKTVMLVFSRRRLGSLVDASTSPHGQVQRYRCLSSKLFPLHSFASVCDRRDSRSPIDHGANPIFLAEIFQRICNICRGRMRPNQPQRKNHLLRGYFEN
jgi:hypothetical protein